MSALVATTPSRVGTATAGAAVAASDTISNAILGQNGAYLEIINGNAAPDNITISDSGASQAGTPVVSYAATVANGASKIFFISPKQVDPASGNVTITHSVTTTVTYKLYPK